MEVRKVSGGKLLATYNRAMYFCIYNYGILWLIRGTVFPYFNISEISVHLYIGSSLNSLFARWYFGCRCHCLCICKWDHTVSAFNYVHFRNYHNC